MLRKVADADAYGETGRSFRRVLDTAALDRFVERVGDRYDIDLAALAFGSSGYLRTQDGDELTTWYADESKVVAAAAQTGTDRLLPTHWDIWRSLTADPTALWPHIRSHDAPRTLDIVEIGDRLAL